MDEISFGGLCIVKMLCTTFITSGGVMIIYLSSC